ncbi:MAG: tetratricopeptide repeat protein [Cocleimonas sp.]|nr:tetratricopeptide repeat protein [Cocleimonas sp.]
MRLLVVISFMLLLGGCSGLDNRPERTPHPPVLIVKPMPAPKIPEIKAPKIVKVNPYRYNRSSTIKHRPISRPKYKVTTKPKYKAPIIGRYPRPGSAQRQTAPQNRTSTTRKTKAIALEDTPVDIDPYANIPENADDKGSGRAASSPAVEALLVRAYADAKLGRTNAAMRKLERGLRIEPQNPKLWNQLAELHYKKGSYQQAIAMAKKAISLSASDKEMTDKNWQFISKVAEKSKNSHAMSEVNEYKKRQ